MFLPHKGHKRNLFKPRTSSSGMPQQHYAPLNGFREKTFRANGYALKQGDASDNNAPPSPQRELPESVLAGYYGHDVLTRAQEKALNKEMRDALTSYRYEVLSSGFAASSIVDILTEKNAQDAVGLDSSWLVEAVFPAWRYALRKKEEIMARVQKTRELLSSGNYTEQKLIRTWEVDCAGYRKTLAHFKPTARLLDFCLEGYGGVQGMQHYHELLAAATTNGTESFRREIQKKVALETLILPERLPSLLTRAATARATFVEKRDLFLLHNLKFTKTVVAELADYLSFTFSDFIDLESVGNQGAQRAVERFRADKAKYTTFARWWIYQSALREIQKTKRGMRLPIGIQKKLRSLRRAIAGIQEEEGEDYEPSAGELAALTDISKPIIASFLQREYEVVSLHTSLGKDGDEIGALVEDTTQRPAYEEAHLNGCKMAIDELLTTLDPREAAVVRERFGLNEKGVSKTLAEVGKQYKVTRERIRQIVIKALEKLRGCLERKEYEFTGKKSPLSRDDVGY